MDPRPKTDETLEGPALEELLHLHIATLYHPGVGVRLVETFGGPASVLSQPSHILGRTPGVTSSILQKLRSSRLREQGREEARVVSAERIFVHAWGTPEYPPELLHLVDRPLVLFTTAPLHAESQDRSIAARLAVVGTRRPSLYGARQCTRFVSAVSRHGLEIVSGLARGIDGRAHEAALDTGAPTTAILGCGLGRIYPPEHRSLANRIRSSPGSRLVSELPFGATPRSFHFPMRNRILVGVARCLFVIEAGERSGSLITVRHALDQGKTVFVLPGRVDSEEARGCLRLLSDGAAVAIEPDDILLEFPELARLAAELPNSVPEQALGKALVAAFAQTDAWHPNALAAHLKLPLTETLQLLNRLELEGHVRRVPGGHYALR